MGNFLIGKNTRILYKSGTNYLNVEGIKSITLPSDSPDELDTAQYGVAGDFDSFMPGLITAGTFGLTQDYTEAAYDTFFTLMLAKTNIEFVILFKIDDTPTYDAYKFNAYVTGMPITCSVGEIMTNELNLQLTGQMTKITTPSPLPAVPTQVYGIKGLGTQIKIAKDETTPTYKDLIFAYECNGPDFTLSYEDIAYFEMAGIVKEKLPLTFSVGNFEITSIVATDTVTGALKYDDILGYAQISQKCLITITYPDGSYFSGKGYVMDVNRDVPIKGKQGYSFSFRLTEKPTFTKV